MRFSILVLLSMLTVVYCGGTVRVELQEYSYTGCSDTCQMDIKNLTLSTDNIVRKNSSEISLPSGNTVTLLGNDAVPFLKDAFEFHFLTGPLGIDFYVYAKNGRLIEHVDESLGLKQFNMGTEWNERVRTRGDKKDKKFKFFIKFTSCDANFEGDGCGSCKANYYTSTCDIYCKPVTDQYNCDSNGGRECLGNWEGSDCDSCQLGWNGTNCDTCATGWNGTNCDACATNYYPAGLCDVLCIEDTNYTCSEVGEKLCSENSLAPECSKSSPVGAIVGGVGGLLAVVLLTVLGIVAVRRRREDQEDGPVTMTSLDNPRQDEGNADTEDLYTTVDKAHSDRSKEEEHIYADSELGQYAGQYEGNVTMNGQEGGQYASVEFLGNRATIDREREMQQKKRKPEETTYAQFNPESML